MTLWRVVGGLGRVLLVLGVLVLLFAGYLLWGTGLVESAHQSALRQEFDQALAHPDPSAPTPTPATSSTAATTLPPDVVQELSSGRAPGEGQPVAILRIPKIGVEKVVVEGTGEDDLRLGPGHYVGTPLPGQPGNAAIAGHRTTYGAPFYNLDELTAGDRIEVTTLQGRFTYVVHGSHVVDPTETSVLNPTSSAELTLTTCNPRYSAAQRLVVTADLLDAPVRAPAPAPISETGASRSAELAGASAGWGGAVGWGIGTLAAATALWLAARRLRRWRRAAVIAGGAPVLVLLFFFFAAVAPLLPASF